MGYTITKTTTKEYEVVDVWPFLKFGSIQDTRESCNMDVQRCCFGCNHKFERSETTYLAPIKHLTNKLLCKDCAVKAAKALGKEINVQP